MHLGKGVHADDTSLRIDLEVGGNEARDEVRNIFAFGWLALRLAL
jgi:hypothetical protein